MSSHAPATARHLNHLPALDGLRGLAILLVLGHNFASFHMPQGLAGHVIELVLDGGWIGVQLFFVLSGFLITRILLQTQDAPNYYRAFFGRRVLRIFPLYYAALFVAFVVFPLLGRVGATLAHDQGHQIWLWLYLSNWTHLLNFESQLFPHFWSLAIEEQFYLLWPLLVHRRMPRQVLWVCLGLAVVSPIVRAVMLWQGAQSGMVYTYTVCRMDALALGAAVAAWLQMPGVAESVSGQRQRLAWAVVGLWTLGLLVTHGYPQMAPLGQILGYSWLAVVFAMAVLLVACGRQSDAAPLWGRGLAAKPLRMFGQYSYAMYIFHKPVHDFIGKPLLVHYGLLEQPSYVIGLVYLIVATLVTLLAAMLSYHLFEKHFLAMKRWFVAEAPAAPALNPR